jgi:hypothetical protein
MTSKLVKIVLTAGAIILTGSFGLNHYNTNTKYNTVYERFVREVSNLNSPCPNDNPTPQEWAMVCSEMGIEYTSGMKVRPSLEEMKSWLGKRGVYECE